MPTGQVVDGAVAAAQHDQGNWMRAFPDSSAEVTCLIGNDDWTIVQHRGFGTNTGELQLGGQTFPPTGKKMEIRVLDIVQYRDGDNYADGKAMLIRNYYDMAAVITQLGIVPGQAPGAK